MRELTRNISHFPLKAIFAVHFLLVAWATQGWYSGSMVLFNTLFLVCLLWAVHKADSDEPIQFALFLTVSLEFLDFVELIIGSPFDGSTYRKFTVSIVIINMIARVFTFMYLLKIGQQRGGSLATMFNSSSPGLGRQGYEDISHPVPQNPDFATI